jgi:hypothetical protein
VFMMLRFAPQQTKPDSGSEAGRLRRFFAC